MAKRKTRKTQMGANPLDLVIGTLGATLTDILIDYPLSMVGALYAVGIKDAADNHIWGYGTGDAVVDATGDLLYLFGDKIGVNKYVGLSWLLAHGAIKLGEIYNYLRVAYPIPPYPHYYITI